MQVAAMFNKRASNHQHLPMDGNITRRTNVNRRNNGTDKTRQETHTGEGA